MKLQTFQTHQVMNSKLRTQYSKLNTQNSKLNTQNLKLFKPQSTN